MPMTVSTRCQQGVNRSDNIVVNVLMPPALHMWLLITHGESVWHILTYLTTPEKHTVSTVNCTVNVHEPNCELESSSPRFSCEIIDTWIREMYSAFCFHQMA